jgi:hypothetical protein
MADLAEPQTIETSRFSGGFNSIFSLHHADLYLPISSGRSVDQFRLNL